MTHIHIVEPYHSGAMQRFAMPIMEQLRASFRMTTGDIADPNADLNYHIPWHSLVDLPEDNSKHVGLYTHLNKGADKFLVEAIGRADYIISMAYAGRQEVLDMGAKNVFATYPGTDKFATKPVTIGLVGREQPNGRKRSHILLDLVWALDARAYHFIVLGGDWDDVIAKARQAGATITHITMASDPELASYYQQMDILVSTGYVEGGPMPLAEAMASGTPVLSPNYGFAKDLLPDEWKYDSVKELGEKLEAMAEERFRWSSLAQMFSWRQWVDEHLYIFCKVLGIEVPQIGDSGMRRYSQLLDLAAELKPESIMEIGTWGGERASQLIQLSGAKRYYGFDLFGGHGGSSLIKSAPPVETVKRRLQNTGAKVHLVAGDSRETIGRLALNKKVDLIFVDGGHDFETVKSDWESIQKFIGAKTVVVFDDYVHAPDDVPEEMAGPRLLAQEIKGFQHMPLLTQHEKYFGTMELGMIKCSTPTKTKAATT